MRRLFLHSHWAQYIFANTKHLYNICTMSAQRLRFCSNLYKCYANVLRLLGIWPVYWDEAFQHAPPSSLIGASNPRLIADVVTCADMSTYNVIPHLQLSDGLRIANSLSSWSIVNKLRDCWRHSPSLINIIIHVINTLLLRVWYACVAKAWAPLYKISILGWTRWWYLGTVNSK